jgi:hypothetical protein
VVYWWMTWQRERLRCKWQSLRLKHEHFEMWRLTQLHISAGQQHIFEQRAVVHFFAEYANDCLKFRDYISGSTGIPFLVQAIKAVEDEPFGSNESQDVVWYICGILADLSNLDWCIPMLVCLDVCPTLVKLLMYVCTK